MTKANKLRLHIMKQQIKENKLDYLNNLDDKDILKLLDLAVLPNSMDSKSVRYGLIFNLLFTQNKNKKEILFNQLNRIKTLDTNLSRTERKILKFGIIHGFSSSNYRIELFRYINNPFMDREATNGRKFISSYKFKEIFKFAYNLIKRGKNNEQLPKY